MALDQQHQRHSLGSLALRQILVDRPDITAVASTSRNPGVLRRMEKAGCTTVSPDIHRPDNALHYFQDDPLVQDLTLVVAEAIGANIEDVPYVIGKYGSGLYGQDTDPGTDMPMKELSEHPGNAVIVVGTDINRGES